MVSCMRWFGLLGILLLVSLAGCAESTEGGVVETETSSDSMAEPVRSSDPKESAGVGGGAPPALEETSAAKTCVDPGPLESSNSIVMVPQGGDGRVQRFDFPPGMVSQLPAENGVYVLAYEFELPMESEAYTLVVQRASSVQAEFQAGQGTTLTWDEVPDGGLSEHGAPDYRYSTRLWHYFRVDESLDVNHGVSIYWQGKQLPAEGRIILTTYRDLWYDAWQDGASVSDWLDCLEVAGSVTQAQSLLEGEFRSAFLGEFDGYSLSVPPQFYGRRIWSESLDLDIVDARLVDLYVDYDGALHWDIQPDATFTSMSFRGAMDRPATVAIGYELDLGGEQHVGAIGAHPRADFCEGVLLCENAFGSTGFYLETANPGPGSLDVEWHVTSPGGSGLDLRFEVLELTVPEPDDLLALLEPAHVQSYTRLVL